VKFSYYRDRVVTRSHERRLYGQFCPVARTLDIVGERWTLLVVRDLMTGPLRFSDLRTHLPDLSPALLTQRLRDLEADGIVHRVELPPPAARTVYELTERGRALEPVIYELARFGLPYLDAPTASEPMFEHMLPLGIRALVVAEALPRRAFVMRLELDEGVITLNIAPPRPGPAIGRLDAWPGEPQHANAALRGSIAVALWVRRGDLTFDDAEQQGLLSLAGSDRHVATARALFGFN
jgi:DNA-binding HxlR family transcriptional regulator